MVLVYWFQAAFVMQVNSDSRIDLIIHNWKRKYVFSIWIAKILISFTKNQIIYLSRTVKYYISLHFAATYLDKSKYRLSRTLCFLSVSSIIPCVFMSLAYEKN